MNSEKGETVLPSLGFDYLVIFLLNNVHIFL